ncbi:Uncharacterised protein [Mycobacteroides abscessus subsp. abscessus]|nr:Uncharacterised protein [Mycobacteroides abscessus]SHY01340.1 Uncharacterised protein [Mycobacteroides abscessus subsp. abscessus]
MPVPHLLDRDILTLDNRAPAQHMSATLIVHDGVQRPFGTELGLIQSVEKARNHLGTTQVCH